jgi:rifampin ADP-ribosylating transferase
MSSDDPPHLRSISDAIAAGAAWVPVTFTSYAHVTGPFFHGTKAALAVGDALTPGFGSNYQPGRSANHVYFAALLEPAIWGAELAVAPAGGDAQERIYVVEPTGPFEDDPNVTNKKFPGNVTQSYRSRHPLRIVAEVEHWDPHPPEVRQAMLDSLAALRAKGLDLIED